MHSISGKKSQLFWTFHLWNGILTKSELIVFHNQLTEQLKYHSTALSWAIAQKSFLSAINLEPVTLQVKEPIIIVIL